MNKSEKPAHVTMAESTVGLFGQHLVRNTIIGSDPISTGRKKAWGHQAFDATAN